MMHKTLLAMVLFFPGTLCAVANSSNDNVLAHELYASGDYARAAEIFTDPAWKGVALYRSSQWWRAAEAFIRADDAVSMYNLGNAYVKLSYYALALEAYQAALARDPTLTAARHNADIMRQLLANDDDEQGQGLLQPKEEALDQLDNEDGEESSSGDAGKESGDKGEPTPGDEQEGNKPTNNPVAQANAGGGGDAQEQQQQQDDGAPGTSELSTEENSAATEDAPSSGADSEQVTDASQAAGTRGELDSEQATEQWLNRIQHNPNRFLEKRIALEIRRREAAGQSAPQGGSSW